MPIEERIAKKFFLTQAGEYRLLPFDDVILEIAFNRFSGSDFYNFIELCKDVSDKKGIVVFWEMQYLAYERAGLEKNALLTVQKAYKSKYPIEVKLDYNAEYVTQEQMKEFYEDFFTHKKPHTKNTEPLEEGNSKVEQVVYSEDNLPF